MNTLDSKNNRSFQSPGIPKNIDKTKKHNFIPSRPINKTPKDQREIKKGQPNTNLIVKQESSKLYIEKLLGPINEKTVSTLRN